MSKPIVFDQDEVALCPSGHGPMLMVPEGEPRVFSVFGIEMPYVLMPAVPEARAYCLECRHTMIVADERGV